MSSVAFNKIVPFGQNFVFNDMPLTLTLKERVAFFLCLIYVSVDSRKYSESRLGSCLGSFHETPFEQPASGIVGTSSITKDADTLCTWMLPEVHDDLCRRCYGIYRGRYRQG